jgi:FtsH-binding integral membrane protein
MIGVIIASIINIFIGSSLMEMIVSAVAVLVFAGFTVYDQQAYKNIYQSISHDPKEVERYTILGALHMYINLVVMFQNLLSLFGDRE